MRKTCPTIVALLLALGMSHSSFAAPRSARSQGSGCYARAVHDLKRLSPRGYAIYVAMKDKKQFLTWLTCDELQISLATAVHESVHILTQERDAFPLINGGEVKRPHEVSRFFAPKQIAKRFDRKDDYVQNYLTPGHASSADDFMYLLDELNAYSHDLNSATALVSLQRRDQTASQRDGLEALMMFVMAYVDAARKNQPATWRGLMQPGPRKAVQTLWSQAEKALESSCAIPNFGINDRAYIGFMCQRRNGAALGEVLGRAPICAAACAGGTTAMVH